MVEEDILKALQISKDAYVRPKELNEVCISRTCIHVTSTNSKKETRNRLPVPPDRSGEEDPANDNARLNRQDGGQEWDGGQELDGRHDGGMVGRSWIAGRSSMAGTMAGWWAEAG